MLLCAMLAGASLYAQDDGFVSLMPKRDIAEQWIAERRTLLNAADIMQRLADC